MIIAKIFGGGLILLGCSGLSLYIIGKKSMRIRILRELEKDLQYLYGEIEYAAPDMAEIMERLASRGGIMSSFFRNMKGRILMHQGMRFSEYWKDEMEQITGIENLTSSDKEFFLQIGENLGNLDRMTQLRTLEIFQKRLQGILLKAENEYYGKAKISMVIGITGGIFLVILLF